MMIVKRISEINLCNEELDKETERMLAQPLVYDEDSPETTAELYAVYEPEAARQRAAREHPIIALPVKRETLKQAQALGEGYKAILGRLVELALHDQELLKKCM